MAVAEFEERIAPELAAFAVPLDSLTQHPDNYRKHSLMAIAKSLEDHGQRALIVVHEETGFIVKGNGTWAAAKMLGWTNVAAIRQSMSDEDALAFLFADNKASDLASNDRRKVYAGLKKLQDGPGLFDDSGWTVEEFADLDDELQGEKVLDAQDSDAAFADEGKIAEKKERSSLPGEKMREVPVVLTVADHALFVERLKILQKRFGTGGTIATITEAVKRQAEAEEGVPIQVGKPLDDLAVKRARRSVAVEFRNLVSQLGTERQYTGLWLIAQMEKMAPYVPPDTPAPDVLPGQAEAFDPTELQLEDIDANAALAEDPPTVAEDEREAVAPEASA
jgi:ParB-like chromosome segregation protein Spo0J